jgi:AcrR family transcriptional regulator
VRERVVDGAIAVIARDGLDALSIRRVASEVGVAIGTVQHHYPSRAELVLAALRRTADRQRERAMATPRSSSVLGTLADRLAALLPHDDAGRQEAIVWVALAAAAARDPLVGPHQRRIVSETIAGIAALLDRARETGELPADTDTSDLAERVDAVVDGHLLRAAASGTIVSHRGDAQFHATLAALFAREPGTRHVDP